LNEAIQEVNSLLVIPAGATPQDTPPFEILSSEKLQTFLKNTASQFDLVLIDSAAIKRHRDPLMLSSMVDGTLLVIEANKTQRRSILMAHRKIEEAGGKLKGIILNKQVNPIPAFILER
jgi:Mrp family chromosome partitioning ATPase